ncbi:MAG: SWIM zinc finger family protein [Acidobacteriota bacterium]
MTHAWSRDSVLGLAPDARSLKLAQGLAKAEKWSLLAHDDEALWGEIRDYKTEIDFDGPGFKCSCPSFKFPCKHALALFLVFAEYPEAVAEGKQPEWVSEWIASRRDRAKKKAAKQAARKSGKKKAVKDVKAQARRVAAREKRVASGLDELSTWMEDLVRQGLGQLPQASYSYWDTVAKRMVDAQASGLERHLRELEALVGTGDDWTEPFLHALGRLHLLVRSGRQLEGLSPELQERLRIELGWNLSKDELLSRDGVKDEWRVMGQVETIDRVRTQRTWLAGRESGRTACVLQHAPLGAGYPTMLLAGTQVRAELSFPPGPLPIRAIVKDKDARAEPVVAFDGPDDLREALAERARGLARDPWLDRWAMTVTNVQLHLGGEEPSFRWSIQDAKGARLPIVDGWHGGWKLLALTGGAPCSLFSEFGDASCLPLSCVVDGRFHSLTLPAQAGEAA